MACNIFKVYHSRYTHDSVKTMRAAPLVNSLIPSLMAHCLLFETESEELEL